MFDELKFVFPFRRYQELILHTLDERIKNKDRKFHVVSPPGSGKTIVGLEFTKRLNKKAVVFAPTSTIQHQWKDKVGMFLQDKKKVADYVSTTPHTIKPINIYTYRNFRPCLRWSFEEIIDLYI